MIRPSARVGELRQAAGDVFVRQAMKAVAFDAFCGQRPWQGKKLGNFRLTAVKGGVEAGDLRDVR
jgi:hypothetical protein